MGSENRCQKYACLSAMLVAAGGACGQDEGQARVGPQRLIDVLTPVSETSIAVYAGSGSIRILTGVMHWFDSGGGATSAVHYSVSVDAGSSWTVGELSPFVIGDPYACADPGTGTLWMVGLQRPGAQVHLWKLAPTSASLTYISQVGAAYNAHTGEGFAYDKPVLAIGPDSTLYVFGTQALVSPIDPTYRPLALQISDDAGQNWLTEQGNDASIQLGLHGYPTSAVTTGDGAIYLLYKDPVGCDIHLATSDLSGVTWDSVPVATSLVCSSTTNLPGGIVPASLWANASAAIAHDSASGNIYVAYQAARSSHVAFYNGLNLDPDPANVDVIIARSTDGGQTFAPWFAVPDHEMGEYGSDEFLPSIAFDSFGGLNVLWYSSIAPDSDSSTDVYARYLRIAQPGTMQQTTELHDLTPEPFLMPVPGTLTAHMVGDYQQLSASGKYVFPCYMSTGPWAGLLPAQDRRYCLHQIDVCPADLNNDGSVDSVDYNLALSGGAADYNGDGIINSADFGMFYEDWLAGCQ